MENIDENNFFSIPSKPKSDRRTINHMINRQIYRNGKFSVKKINLKNKPFLNLKYQNQNKILFSKLSPMYSTSFNSNLINSAQNPVKKNLSFYDEIPYNHIKELSPHIFQSNDVDFVRNLDPDSNKDLINNLLFKGLLKNRLESKFNFTNYRRKGNIEKNGEKTENGFKGDDDGDGERNKALVKKLSKIKQNNLLEKELSKKLKEIKKNYDIKRLDKIKISNKFKQMVKEIEIIGYDIQFLEDKSKENAINNTKLLEMSSNMKSKEKLQGFHKSPRKKTQNKLSEKDENAKKTLNVLQDLFESQKKLDLERKEKLKKILELKKRFKTIKNSFKFNKS